jgi:TetR/AcrR family fatty acid metabolism transcriptional regulator
MRKTRNSKTKIIHAALKVFAKKGFFEATVDDIAKAAGVAKGTIYLYFNDKSSIYFSSIDEHFTEILQFISDIEKRGISSDQKLREIALEMLDYMHHIHTSSPIFFIEDKHFSDKMMKDLRAAIWPKVDQLIMKIGHIVRKGIDTGEFRNIDHETVALHFLNMVRAMFFVSHSMPNVSMKANDTFLLFFSGLNRRR